MRSNTLLKLPPSSDLRSLRLNDDRNYSSQVRRQQPEQHTPQPGLQLIITISQFSGFTSNGFPFPILNNGFDLPPIPITGNVIPANGSFVPTGVANTSVQYWVSCRTSPGLGPTWNPEYEVVLSNSGQFSVSDGQTTSITLHGNVEHIPT